MTLNPSTGLVGNWRVRNKVINRLCRLWTTFIRFLSIGLSTTYIGAHDQVRKTYIVFNGASTGSGTMHHLVPKCRPNYALKSEMLSAGKDTLRNRVK